MTKKERDAIKKMPAKEVREAYAGLLNELRDKRNRAPSVSSHIYNTGWDDGYNAGRNSKLRARRVGGTPDKGY